MRCCKGTRTGSSSSKNKPPEKKSAMSQALRVLSMMGPATSFPVPVDRHAVLKEQLARSHEEVERLERELAKEKDSREFAVKAVSSRYQLQAERKAAAAARRREEERHEREALEQKIRELKAQVADLQEEVQELKKRPRPSTDGVQASVVSKKKQRRKQRRRRDGSSSDSSFEGDDRMTGPLAAEVVLPEVGTVLPFESSEDVPLLELVRRRPSLAAPRQAESDKETPGEQRAQRTPQQPLFAAPPASPPPLSSPSSPRSSPSLPSPRASPVAAAQSPPRADSGPRRAQERGKALSPVSLSVVPSKPVSYARSTSTVRSRKSATADRPRSERREPSKPRKNRDRDAVLDGQRVAKFKHLTASWQRSSYGFGLSSLIGKGSSGQE